MFSTATCSCDVSTSVLGDTVLYKGLASSCFSSHSQQSEDNQVQLVSGSAAAALPGLHPQATLSNSLLGLTCYAFTTSVGLAMFLLQHLAAEKGHARNHSLVAEEM